MASVKITRRWPDGDTLEVKVHATTSYPDALSEAKATAITAFSEALGIATQDAE